MLEPRLRDNIGHLGCIHGNSVCKLDGVSGWLLPNHDDDHIRRLYVRHRIGGHLRYTAVLNQGIGVAFAEAEAIDASLIALYRSARDTHEKTELLGALGNSSGPLVVPVIEEALHESTVPIRSAAARGLRLAPGPDADHILATVINSDSDATVRADAVFATRFRHPLPASLADALMHAASYDTANYVRSDAIAVLRQNPTASPQIPETLDRIAQFDADAGIRRQAKEALSAFSPQVSTLP